MFIRAIRGQIETRADPMAPAPAKTPAPADDDSPGLPGFRSWRAVYALVFVVFLLVVAGLTVFSRVYS